MDKMQARPILLVEDDLADMELARVALADAEVQGELECLPDGAALLARLRGDGPFVGRPRPSLIILDLNLPNTVGMELISTIKRNPELKAIPLVVFSSSADPRLVAEAYARDANAFTHKPVDLTGFTQALRKTVEYWLLIVRAAPM
jgi:two-component system, chemotaxis family, response regulator Rcp1